MTEEPLEGDPLSARDAGLAYHAYSASGDVTAPVVSVNSGDPADYDQLAQRGVDVKGKIVLVRYSVPYSYRGFKALTAEQRGAASHPIPNPTDYGFRKVRSTRRARGGRHPYTAPAASRTTFAPRLPPDAWMGVRAWTHRGSRRLTPSRCPDHQRAVVVAHAQPILDALRRGPATFLCVSNATRCCPIWRSPADPGPSARITS